MSDLLTADKTIKSYSAYLSVDRNTARADNRRVISYLLASETKYRADEGRIIVNRYYV